MPGIRLFNRTWHIGSDDFVWPVLLENVIRLTGFIFFVIFYIQFFTGIEKCNNFKLSLFYSGIIGILLVSIVSNLLLAYRSSLGTVFDSERNRSCVGCLVVFKYIFYLFEFAWIVMGTFWFFKYELLKFCHSLSMIIVSITLMLEWVYFLCLVILIFIFFNPLGGGKNDISKAFRVWKLRFRICCYQAWSFETSQAYDEVTHYFSNYFLESRLIASDIVAGLILLRRDHKLKYLEKPESEYLLPYDFWKEKHNNLTCYNLEMTYSNYPNEEWKKPKKWMNLKMAAYFAKYSIANYAFRILNKKKRFSLYKNFFGQNSLQLDNTSDLKARVHYDPQLRNAKAILKIADIAENDLLYATFYNQLFAIPFFIAADHKLKYIVISIRGTNSIYDLVTDANIDYEKLDFEGSKFKAHKGIVKSAVYIKKEIDAELLLKTAFLSYPNYGLIILGHSLGAGTAALLAILLKPTYPNLICFAYSPPGWLVSRELARKCEPFICTVVLGKDVVPRMGKISLINLKYELIRILRNSKEPKYRILSNVICPAFGSQENKVVSTNENTRLVDSMASKRDRQMEETILFNQMKEIDLYPLYLPGQIIYLHQVSSKNFHRSFVAYWTRPEYFDKILISLRMLKDHKQSIYIKMLNRTAARYFS